VRGEVRGEERRRGEEEIVNEVPVLERSSDTA
jgi:hypothetical protein